MISAKVLIVEDNPMNLELVGDILADEGLEIISAEDAVQGIALAQAEKPDLILMDLELPGLDGLQATRLLKEDGETGEIPVVALSAHAMSHHEDQAREAGCIAFITKPIDVDTFADEILQLLASSCKQSDQ